MRPKAPISDPVSQAARHAIEPLENRLFLSVAPAATPAPGDPVWLRNGTLLVAGTARGDSIRFVRDDLTRTQLEVTLNKVTTKFNLADVKVIRCYGFSGSDDIRISEANGAIAMPIYVFGGYGNDTVVGGSGNDTLVGSVGNDFLQGNAGNDWLEGNQDNDSILGGDGRDHIEGGPGKDLINTGGSPRDVVINTDGDTVNTGLAALATPQKKLYYGIDTPKPQAFNPTVTEYTPQQIRKAYGFGDLSDPNTNLGRGQTIAIVNAYHYPTAKNDLNVFSKQFGLPLVDDKSFVQSYARFQPATVPIWAEESALDIEWAHAIAPLAKIVLVEAQSPMASDLFAAVQKAVNMLEKSGGVISMSWGVDETAAGKAWDNYLHNIQTGKITFVAAAGDVGSQVLHPAVSPEVLAVGSTYLPLDSAGNRTGEETAWMNSGGGTSTVFARPAYQELLQVEGSTIGNFRDIPDVSYVGADGAGVATYSTTPNRFGDTGWSSTPGTSVGTPQWGAIIALANEKRLKNGLPMLGAQLAQAYIYGLARRFPGKVFNDIVSGSNGTFTATEGFDRASGWGTPKASALINLLATATSKSRPVLSEGRIGFQWHARFIKALDAGLPSNAVVDFSGNGVMNVNLTTVSMTFAQFPTLTGDVLDIVAPNLQRIGNTIVGRGSGTALMADGTPGQFLIAFEGRLFRTAGGQDQVEGKFYAISRRGRIIQQGLQSIVRGEFATVLR